MISQISDFKDNYFLDLLDNNLYNIKLLYIKRSLWIKHFGHSNPLCTKATQVITNYALIEGYHLGFFPREKFSHLYRLQLIEIKHHIFYKYRRYNKYWNLLRSILSHLVVFLKFNPDTFSFYKAITQQSSFFCSCLS